MDGLPYQTPYERDLAAARSLTASQVELDVLAGTVQSRIEHSGRNHQEIMAKDVATIREDLAGIAAGMDALGMFPETGLLVIVPFTEHQQGITLDRYGELLLVNHQITARRAGARRSVYGIIRPATDREYQTLHSDVVEDLHWRMVNRPHR